MVPKILLVQFRRHDKAAALEYQSISRVVGDDVLIHCVAALDTAIAWEAPQVLLEGYRGVIFGGSGDFDFDGGRSDDDEAKIMSQQILERLRPLISYLFSNDIPTLGICFGHQLLGVFAGARVVHDVEQRKTKSHPVLLTDTAADRYPLFRGVPASFDAYYIHKDALDRIPEGAELIGHGGEACRYSVLRYKNNIYSTQFHPELTFDDVLVRIESFPGYLPEGVTADVVFSRDTNSNVILYNFGVLVKENAE